MDPAEHDAGMSAALAALGFERHDPSPWPTRTARIGPNRFRSVAERPSMGTLVSITAVDPSTARMEEALGHAYREMDRVVDLLNRYDDRSALSLLNREGRMADAPVELSAVLERAFHYHSLSDGAFDVTVQPLVDLFQDRGLKGVISGAAMRSRAVARTREGRSGAGSAAPRRSWSVDPEVADALELVDGRAVTLRDRSVHLERSGMGVTLDGIAKGYVVDRMAEVLSQHGLADWLIDAGGDIRSAGRREDGHPWRIGVQDPRKRGELPDVIELSGGAVATSGSYEIYFDHDRTLHHLIDSDTGRSAGTCQSASVVAPSAMAADALATAVFIMGPERGVPFIDSLAGCACLTVDAGGRQRRSARWRSMQRNPGRQNVHE